MQARGGDDHDARVIVTGEREAIGVTGTTAGPEERQGGGEGEKSSVAHQIPQRSDAGRPSQLTRSNSAVPRRTTPASAATINKKETTLPTDRSHTDSRDPRLGLRFALPRREGPSRKALPLSL